MNILVLGASFTGEYLADFFEPEHRIYFASRRGAELARAGRRVYPADSRRVEAVPRSERESYASAASQVSPPPPIDAILDTVPAIADPGDENAILEPPYHALVKDLLARDSSLPYVHVSSTSVLPGSDRGASRAAAEESGDARRAPLEFDETTPVGPENSRGERRLRLERRIRELYPRAGILRSTGIYGPGRSIASQFQRGDFRRTNSGNVYVSRIHVHDLARLFLAMAACLRKNSDDPMARLVHAVDERPTANEEVFSFLERELSVDVPGDWRGGGPRGRIIRSLYARDLLGDRYRYPTYVEGFRACLAGEAAGL